MTCRVAPDEFATTPTLLRRLAVVRGALARGELPGKKFASGVLTGDNWLSDALTTRVLELENLIAMRTGVEEDETRELC